MLPNQHNSEKYGFQFIFATKPGYKKLDYTYSINWFHELSFLKFLLG